MVLWIHEANRVGASTMSGFGSDLHRFGLDPDSKPDQQQWSNLCRVIRALVNNPSLIIGSENSEVVMPTTGFLMTGGAPAPDAVTGAWNLTVERDGSTFSYRVSSVRSTITNGTNGAALPVSGLDTPTAISGTRWIVVEGDVAADLGISNLAIVALSSLADVKDVRMTSSSPIRQNKIRYYVGKITFAGTPAVPTVTQAGDQPLIVTTAFLNGAIVKVLAPHTNVPA